MLDRVLLLSAPAQREAAVTQRVFLALTADARHYPQLDQRCRAAAVEPWMLVLREVMRRGLGTGGRAPGTEIERVHALLMAPIQAQLLVKGGRDPLPPHFPRCAVETVLRGIAGQRSSPSR